jgi:ornithine cyclodeaminase/alanine dehydrogenase-like protein (mu-crystallin family)
MDECIEVVQSALIALERGGMSQPLRCFWAPPTADGTMGWMSAHRALQPATYGAKVVCVIPSNPARGLDRHQGQVLLFDGRTGELRSLVDASAITAIRTAASSAIATRLLAREEVTELAIIGTGGQARMHLESIPKVRPLTRVRIAGRTPQHAREFVERWTGHHPFRLEASRNVEDAVKDADVVVTATTSKTPILVRAWLKAGTHVNAVGASQPTSCEIDPSVVAGSRLFTDRRESLETEAAEYRLALEDGLISSSHLCGELGAVLTGSVSGRTSEEELTLFRSLGLAVCDLATADFAVTRARALGIGQTVSG